MDLLQDLRRRAAYDGWANRTLAAALRDATPEATRLVAHAAESTLVWLRRIAGTQPPSVTADFWPPDDAAACCARAERAAAALERFVGGLTIQGLAAEAVYTNSAGTAFRTPVLDVLTHVLLHAHYHRGQAAAALRRAGVDPPPTDYVVWQRAGPEDASR